MGSGDPAVSNRPGFRGSKEESEYVLTKMITLSSIPTFTGFSGDDDNNSSDAGLTKEERKEKYRKQEEEREAIRQKLREKYKIERPRDESIEEPEEESSESESEEEEKEREREYLEELSKKIAIIMTSIIAGFFSMYLLTSFVHLKMKAAVHNMRPPFVERLWVW